MHDKVARFGYSLANSVKMITTVSQSVHCSSNQEEDAV